DVCSSDLTGGLETAGSSTNRHQRRWMKIGETGIPIDGHQQVCLSQNAAQHMHDTVDAIQRESISIRPANPDSRRAERQSLDDVCPRSYPGVEQNRRVA